jgi:hypothetical protein
MILNVLQPLKVESDVIIVNGTRIISSKVFESMPVLFIIYWYNTIQRSAWSILGISIK